MDDSWSAIDQENYRITQKFAAYDIVSKTRGGGYDGHFRTIEIWCDGHFVELIYESEMFTKVVIAEDSQLFIILPRSVADSIEEHRQKVSMILPPDQSFEDRLANASGRALWLIKQKGYTEVRMYRYPNTNISGVPLDQPLFPLPERAPQKLLHRKATFTAAYLKHRPTGGLRPTTAPSE